MILRMSTGLSRCWKVSEVQCSLQLFLFSWRLNGLFLGYFNSLSNALEMKSRVRLVNDKITYAAEVSQLESPHPQDSIDRDCDSVLGAIRAPPAAD